MQVPYDWGGQQHNDHVQEEVERGRGEEERGLVDAVSAGYGVLPIEGNRRALKEREEAVHDEEGHHHPHQDPDADPETAGGKDHGVEVQDGQFDGRDGAAPEEISGEFSLRTSASMNASRRVAMPFIRDSHTFPCANIKFGSVAMIWSMCSPSPVTTTP